VGGVQPCPEVAQKSLAKRSWMAEFIFLMPTWRDTSTTATLKGQPQRRHPNIEMNGPMFGGFGGQQMNGGDADAMAAVKNVGPTPYMILERVQPDMEMRNVSWRLMT
jgi:hypothetical protein